MNRPRTRLLAAFLIFVLCLGTAANVCAQSLISGDISGTVTDPSQAVIPNVTVTVKNVETGIIQTTTSNASGAFRVSLLKPGRYEVSITQPGFAPLTRTVAVAVGQTTTADLALKLAGESTSVEVSGAATLVNSENSNIATTFSQLEQRSLPSAGGDITNIAQTAPGVIMNTTQGYGNFTVNGLPATSNLFTVNGENNMDPYFNINNSGATNMTLGSNEVQEATVISNPYSGQYGQLSGAQVTLVTKYGSNAFHGNAQYWWNGRAMNANNWMNKQSGGSRPFSNANQWAAGLGGPVIKDKTFFYVNTEGLRFVLPNVVDVTMPTADFANAVLANVTALRPNEAGAYKTMLGLWAGAPGASRATPIDNSDACNALTLAGFNPATQKCAQKFQATPTAFGSEWILAFRVDHKIGENDNAFFRYKLDHGVQPTYLDPINNNFDALSNQPSWDAQFQETHIFGTKATNEFMATASHYVAQFAQNEAKAMGTFPYAVITSGVVEFTSFGAQYNYPQGRNITQYQFIDNFSLSHGNHNLKFGENFRRYDVSDHNFYFNSPGVYFGYTTNGLQNFADGIAYQYRKTYNLASNVPVALWGLGLYAMDEWQVRHNLKLTLALRAERNSNPVCQINCFANFVSGWSTLPSVAAGANSGTIPYINDIKFGQHSAFPDVDKVDISPRIGFNWSPLGNDKTVVSGGFGIFYDSPAAGLVDDLLANPPVAVSLRVRPAAGTPGFDTTATGPAAIWQASANAFDTGFKDGQTYTQIYNTLRTMGVPFAAPAFTAIVGTVHAPRWQEWNLQVQQQVNDKTVLTVNYVGNHGIHLPYTNQWANAYDPYYLYNVSGAPGAGLVPNSAPVKNYGQVNERLFGATSNYQGVTVSLKYQWSKLLSAALNYTWSHNLDDASNGGLFTYGDSTLTQLSPAGVRSNYGNSDYDIRHNVTGHYVFHPDLKFNKAGLNYLFGGWEWSGKLFFRTGLPFSVVDGNWAGAITNGGGGVILAQPLGPGAAGQMNCGRSAASSSGNGSPCLDAAAFVDSAANSFMGYSAFSTQQRNQYRGPHFFDMDMNLFKNFTIREKLTFGLGAQAFNVFNHPNFGFPDNSLGSSTFGQISSMTAMPTSPYGTFLGFDSSPRVVQLTAKITF